MLNNCLKNPVNYLKRSCLVLVLLMLSSFVIKNSNTITDLKYVEIAINTSFDFESELDKEMSLDDDYLNDSNYNIQFTHLFSSRINVVNDCKLYNFSMEDPAPPPKVVLC